MSRRSLLILALAVLAPVGCVPVTAPVGDVEKAEPDKALVGTWTVTKSKGLIENLKIQSLTVDAIDVKGTPKGLMRVTIDNPGDDGAGFYVATDGKSTFATVIVGTENDGPPRFHKEGGYAKWKDETKKRYYVFRLVRDGDTLTIDCGSVKEVPDIMKDAKIESDQGRPVPHFKTPAGWLEKYLDKTGADKMFDGTNVLVLKREKK